MTSPSLAVVRAVAADTDSDPSTLEPPLYEVIDPDGLDALVESTPNGGTGHLLVVRFEYHGYDVTVLADGTIELDDAEVDAEVDAGSFGT